MPNPWERPDFAHATASEDDTLSQARLDAFRPPQYEAQQSFFTKPESLTGELLMAGGILGRVLISSSVGRKLALGAAALGLVVTGISALESHPNQRR